MMKYNLGIDEGTSNVKAVLFDECGNEASVSSRESRTINGASNQVEQDMLLVWEKVKQCVKGLIEAGAASGEEVAAIGVTGQGEGC